MGALPPGCALPRDIFIQKKGRGQTSGPRIILVPSEKRDRRKRVRSWPGLSPVAHGRLLSIDLARLRAQPGVVAVLTAADIPGRNDCGPIVHDDPILADGLLNYRGQPVFAVIGPDLDPDNNAMPCNEGNATFWGVLRLLTAAERTGGLYGPLVADDGTGCAPTELDELLLAIAEHKAQPLAHPPAGQLPLVVGGGGVHATGD